MDTVKSKNQTLCETAERQTQTRKVSFRFLIPSQLSIEMVHQVEVTLDPSSQSHEQEGSGPSLQSSSTRTKNTFRMKFKAYHKKLLTQLALVPCRALLPEAGTLRKRTNHGKKNESELSEYQVTFLAFHGSNVAASADVVDSSGKQWMSHVKMLCNLTGPFQAMAEKGYFASVEVHNEQQRRVILNLKYLLGVRQELELDANIETVLHLKGLPKVGKANPIYRERPLGEMWTKIYANVRMIMTFEERYIAINGKLPELGDDSTRHALLDYIWDEMYKEYRYTEVKRKEKEREQEKAAVANTVEADDEDNDGIEVLSLSGSVDVPDDFDPGMLSRANWQPPSIGVYVAYVCKLTRFTDRYLYLFEGNGRSLKDGTIRIRKRPIFPTRSANRVTLDESNEVVLLQETKRHRKDTVDAETQTKPPPAMTSEQLKESANLFLRRSSDERRRLSLAVKNRKEIYDTQVEEEKRSLEMFRMLFPNLTNVINREQDPFYKDFMTKRQQTQEAREEWKMAIDEENIFCAKDELSNKAYEMLEMSITSEEPKTDKVSNPKAIEGANIHEPMSLSQKSVTNEEEAAQSEARASEKH